MYQRFAMICNLAGQVNARFVAIDTYTRCHVMDFSRHVSVEYSPRNSDPSHHISYFTRNDRCRLVLCNQSFPVAADQQSSVQY